MKTADPDRTKQHNGKMYRIVNHGAEVDIVVGSCYRDHCEVILLDGDFAWNLTYGALEAAIVRELKREGEK